MPLRFSRMVAICLLACTAGWLSTAGAQTQQAYNISLSNPEVSTDDAGRTVVTMTARGDLAGTMTMALQTTADGTITAGEWALNVSYTTVTSPDGTIIVGKPEQPSGGDDDAGEVEALVQKGMLKGTVLAGALASRDDGSVSGLSALTLALTSGTLQFQQTTSGSGTLTASNFSDPNAWTGALTVIF